VVKPEVIDFKAVNYTELIPILVKAMQEQYQAIAEKDKVIDELKTEVERIKELLVAKGLTTVKDIQRSEDAHLAKARLDQNIPNPADGSSSVRYFLPSSASKAFLLITSANGAVVKSFPIAKSGEGKISVASADLPAGSYYYSLLIDGKMTDTKKMIISR
jgi:hypothetical protein